MNRESAIPIPAGGVQRPRWQRYSLWIATILALFAPLALIGMRAMIEEASPPPTLLGAREGRLAACPETPNCVSTQSTDAMHEMAPWHYQSSTEEAKALILEIAQGMPRSRVIVDAPNYVHLEFRSLTFRFIDDVEFVFDEEAKVIHFRSAARLGKGDQGVNRARMEAFTHAFAQRSASK